MKPPPPSTAPPGDAPALPKDGTHAPETRWERTKANLKTIGGALLLALVIRIILFEPFEIEGPSMEPTLLNGDRVVVAKFLFGLFLPFTNEAVIHWGLPNAGDVVIVKSPADNIDIVKRVIGLPGDTIEMRDDVVFRNGVPLRKRSAGECKVGGLGEPGGCEWVEEQLDSSNYNTSHSPTSPPSSYGAIRVPPDHVYILGDHRDRSNDSRFFGVVPASRLKGKALFIYWSGDDDEMRWDRVFQAAH